MRKSSAEILQSGPKKEINMGYIDKQHQAQTIVTLQN